MAISEHDRLAGVIDMTFVRRGERTIADRAYHRGNSRISSRLAPSESNEDIPYYILITTGGGLIEGEKYRFDIRLEEDTHAVLSTQAPTPVYKCENRGLTEHDTIISLEPGAFLEYYMDEIIPYQYANYRQFMDIAMAGDATLILTDGLTGGWSPDDRPFTYTEVGMRTRISVDGRLVYNDHLLCSPEQDSMHELGFFEGYTNFNSCVIIDPSIDQSFVDSVRQVLSPDDQRVRFGVSALEGHGAVLRVLGFDSLGNRQVERQFVNLFRESYQNLAPLRLRKNDHIYG